MPHFGEFVERQGRPSDFGVNGKKAGARRWFEHKRTRPKLGGMAHRKAQAQRRRKLLELIAFLRTARVRGQERRELFQHAKIAGRASGFLEHAGPVFAQEQKSRGFGGFIGILPKPGAILIAHTERGRHRLAQGPRVERGTPFQRRKKVSGGLQDAGSFDVLDGKRARGRGRLWRRCHDKIFRGWGVKDKRRLSAEGDCGVMAAVGAGCRSLGSAAEVKALALRVALGPAAGKSIQRQNRYRMLRCGAWLGQRRLYLRCLAAVRSQRRRTGR